MRSRRDVFREVGHRCVMSALDPVREERCVRVVEVARADVENSFLARDALDFGPDLREFHGSRSRIGAIIVSGTRMVPNVSLVLTLPWSSDPPVVIFPRNLARLV